MLVVQAHNPDETLERADLDGGRRALSGLADDLHDVVALSLALKVVADELERVVEGVDSSGLDIGAGLLLAGALDDGGQDLVRASGQVLRLDNLAHVSDSLEGSDTETGVLLISDELQELADELGPLSPGKLNGGDGGDALGGNESSLVDGRAKGLQKSVLEWCANIFRKCHPTLAQCRLVGGVLMQSQFLKFRMTTYTSRQSVLESETSSITDMRLGLLVSKFVGEGVQVGGLRCQR